jgi:S-DNA-T family DNA segregation ATPase FtsK/SpoIIIE
MARRKIINKQDMNGPWNEIIGLILMGIGLVIFLALFSYSSSDPSWNSTGGNLRTRNWIGPMGAKMADGLYQAFGWAAWIVPWMIFIIGRWQWDDDESPVSKPKVLGLFLMIVAVTGWITMIGPDKPGSFYWGGFIGQWLMYGPGIGMARLLGNLGAFVGLVVLFTIGLLLGTDYTLIGLVEDLFEGRQDGMIASFVRRLKIWRQGRNPQPVDTVRPQQVFAKFTQRKYASRQNAPQRNVRMTVRPGVSTHADPALAGQGLNGEAGEQPGQAEEPIIRTPDEGIRIGQAGQAATPVEVPPAARRASARVLPSSPGASPASARQSAARNQRQLTGGPAGDGVAQDDELYPDDFDETETAAQRTVDEMMATASVKRAGVAEEPVKKSSAAKLGQLVKNISRIVADYKLPTTEMLTPPSPRSEMAEAELMERARQLAEKCAEFNVSGQVKQISPGPVVTTFEFKPDPGVKYSRITSLVDDLCLALKAESVRIDRIPGKSTVGIEVPNSHREIIRLREVLESKKYHDSKSKLTLALGKTIDGSNYVADLTKMPHLLIAGATGAGKSVALNTILISLLYKSNPEEVKLILIDPKRLELGLYADIPHLISPIVTDPKRASYALKWAVSEMENRYKHLAAFGVRNIDQYNAEVNSNSGRIPAADDEEAPKPLPYIVVIIDELADLMMVSARDVEESITRLAQMARAVGIHLVLATQRPSVDVITGLIKANFPSRISFRVSSKVDSRTIIDSNGAEQLLGQGDMLFLPPGTSRLVRVHGAYVDEKEVKRISDFVRSQGKPAYDDKIVMSEKELQGDEFGEMKKDEKYDEAVRIVVEMGRASTSVLQRRLRIGYGRAASIIDMMEREGIVGPEDGSKPRQVLVKADFLERLDQIQEEEDL